MSDPHPTGGPKIWSGNQISISLSSRILIHMEEDGCPIKNQPFSQLLLLLQKTSTALGARRPQLGPYHGSCPRRSTLIPRGKGTSLSNPRHTFSAQTKLARALKYTRALFSSAPQTFSSSRSPPPNPTTARSGKCCEKGDTTSTTTQSMHRPHRTLLQRPDFLLTSGGGYWIA